jgi:hypothetical protein
MKREMSEFAAWAREVEALLNERAIEVPAQSTLQNMFDDGLDAEDLLDPKTRQRYVVERARTARSNVGDILADFRKD